MHPLGRWVTRAPRCPPLRVVGERLGARRHYAYAHAARSLGFLHHHNVHGAAVQPLAHRSGDAQDLLAAVLGDLVVAFALARREAELELSGHLVIGHRIQAQDRSLGGVQGAQIDGAQQDLRSFGHSDQSVLLPTQPHPLLVGEARHPVFSVPQMQKGNPRPT
jgi:hypothetical protein